MGDFMDGASSAGDPIFFLHHAQVDRIYAMWLQNFRSQGIFTATDECGGYARLGSARFGQNYNDALQPAMYVNGAPITVGAACRRVRIEPAYRYSDLGTPTVRTTRRPWACGPVGL